MTDQRIYRIAGFSGLAAIALFFIEFPFYMLRGPFPQMNDAALWPAYTLRNATNMMSCVFLDLLILGLLLIFAAGLRHLIRRPDPSLEWLGTLFYAVTLVYITLTFIADGLQGATVVDALTPPANPEIIRGLWEASFLMYGSIALFLMGMFMAVAGWAAHLSTGLPRWSAWLSYICALSCFAFVPAMFVKHVNLMDFYNPAGWGVEAIANGFPLAVWMIALSIHMLRRRDQPGRSAA